MKEKGFTLVELLAVLVILSLLLTITMPIVNDSLNKSQDTVEKNQINTMLNAAYDWSLNNSYLLPVDNNTISITLGQLKSAGLISVNLKSPDNKKLYPNDLIISIRDITGLTEITETKYSKIAGNYLFTLNMESGKDTTKFNKEAPTIILNGNTVTYVNINESYIEPGYTALSSDNTDITNYITTAIKFNNESVATINTTAFGVYYIDYTVNDNNGHSATITRTVIINDKKPPTLIIPSNTTITELTKTFNLTEGASCQDNSEQCTITTTGTLNLGKPGKYIITYTASDSSGNTYSKKRVITIK